MKNGWETKHLGEVLQKTETVDPTKIPNGEFEYIDVSSVNNIGFFVESTTNLKGKDAPSRARKLVKTNDIIFATVRPTLRRIAIIHDDLNNQVCSTGYFVLRANKRIYYKLLFYYLLLDEFNSQMEKLQRGASYPAVTDGDVRDQIISFPKSIAEQQRIVSILDEAFAAIAKAKANTEKNLQNTKELFESYIEQYHYKKERLGDIVDIVTGKLNANAASDDGKFPFFTCSKDVYRINNFAFDCEAVLLAGNNAVGDFNVKYYKGKFNAYQRTYVITAKDGLNLNYRFLFYQMERSLSFLKEKSVGAATKFLKLPVIQNLEIYFPSIIEQNEAVNKLDKLLNQTKKLETIYQQKLNDLEELKKSILQKAFRGELKTEKELEI